MEGLIDDWPTALTRRFNATLKIGTTNHGLCEKDRPLVVGRSTGHKPLLLPFQRAKISLISGTSFLFMFKYQFFLINFWFKLAIRRYKNGLKCPDWQLSPCSRLLRAENTTASTAYGDSGCIPNILAPLLYSGRQWRDVIRLSWTAYTLRLPVSGFQESSRLHAAINKNHDTPKTAKLQYNHNIRLVDRLFSLFSLKMLAVKEMILQVENDDGDKIQIRLLVFSQCRSALTANDLLKIQFKDLF